MFVTHHRLDHYFSANPILEAFADTKLYTHPYVRAGTDREYDKKRVYWPVVFGKENRLINSRTLEVYKFLFFVLPDNEVNYIALLDPLQADLIDHILF